jgi:hypothetical protein
MCCALSALVGATPARAGWTRPVAGAVVGRFTYSRAHAFAAGTRRGADLRAAPGAPVRAPCSGRVSFTGPVPGFGLGVSVRCGGLVATVLRLGAVGPRRGAAVLAGERVGTAGATGVVRLGARRAGDRLGYRDPVALLGGGPGRAPPLAPLGPRVRERWPRTPAPAPARRVAPRASPVARGVPLAAWLGAALVACALTAGISLRRARLPRAALRRSARAPRG